MSPYRVKPLENTTVFSAGLSLPGHISAPAKLQKAPERHAGRRICPCQSMVDCDNGLPPIFVIQPHETEQLAAARCSVSWGRKRVDSTSCRRENAVFPVRRKPPMWVRGNFHAPTSPRHYARRRVSERNRRKAAALSAEMSAQHLMGSPQSCKTLWGEEGQQNE